jgi:hypothetical protein
MSQSLTHRIVVRDKPGLLHRLMVEFLGGRISLEGELSRCRFADDLVVAHEPVGLLKRSTLFPRLDFVVLKLEPPTIEPIFEQIMIAGLRRAIIHVQIEHSGILQLGAYDNFDPDCVFTGPGVSGALLSELKSQTMLRDFFEAAELRRSSIGRAFVVAALLVVALVCTFRGHLYVGGACLLAAALVTFWKPPKGGDRKQKSSDWPDRPSSV